MTFLRSHALRIGASDMPAHSSPNTRIHCPPCHRPINPVSSLTPRFPPAPKLGRVARSNSF
jgi:hypothetical protein